MKKKVIFGTVVLLLAVLGFALDAGITATILFHSSGRTMVEGRSNAGQRRLDLAKGSSEPGRAKPRLVLNGERAEIALAMKQEAERHTAVIKNMYRLRALRLSRTSKGSASGVPKHGTQSSRFIASATELSCIVWAGYVMPTYKFQIGQTVFLTAFPIQKIAGGAYVVTKKLPEHNGEFEYRVKSATEPHERVVREGELSDVPQGVIALILFVGA